MKTTKSYLAGLGTTGVLIASVLTVMVIGTGLVGFDGRELGGGGSPLERVVVGDEARGKPGKSRSRRTDAGGQPIVLGDEPPRPASRQLAAERTRHAGGRRDAAGKRAPRRSNGHGGTPVGADVLSGGAAAGRARGDGPGKPPERSGGGPAPRSSPPPAAGHGDHTGVGGGLPVPAPIERAQEDLHGAQHDALPPGVRR
jgi:hypothetical protein